MHFAFVSFYIFIYLIFLYFIYFVYLQILYILFIAKAPHWPWFLAGVSGPGFLGSIQLRWRQRSQLIAHTEEFSEIEHADGQGWWVCRARILVASCQPVVRKGRARSAQQKRGPGSIALQPFRQSHLWHHGTIAPRALQTICFDWEYASL